MQGERLTLDLSLFYNDYASLVMLTSEKNLGTPFLEGDYFIIPSHIGNTYDGVVYGGELSGEWRATTYWRLVGGVSYVTMDMAGPSADTQEIAGTTPEFSAHLRSLLNVGQRGEFDLLFYYVDEIDYLDVDDYVRTDVRVGWNLSERVALSLVGRNVFEQSQREHYEPTFGQSSYIERSVYARAAYRF
jgi:iron complex outermembrane receptor protein